ncbi:PorT family protein [Sphingobacterium psychroaquaticum]|nr:PorT family protein [Sphingobacterium psychroaquaticum]
MKMKNQIKQGMLVMVMGLLVNQVARAQEVDFGVKAGSVYTMPSYSNKSVSDKKSEFGAQVGIFARTTDRFFVQPELTLSFTSTTYNFEGKKHNPNFYQLHLPIQAGYKFYESEKMGIRASVGPQLNYQLNKAKATSTANYKSFSYDALANVGLDINRFGIDLRYNHGLNTISKELGAKNKSIALSVGYTF